MKIRNYRPEFVKNLNKLPVGIQQKALLAIGKFQNNPFDPTIRNHQLKGWFGGARAISVTGDIRIIFTEENNYETVEIMNIGSHSNLY